MNLLVYILNLVVKKFVLPLDVIYQTKQSVHFTYEEVITHRCYIYKTLSIKRSYHLTYTLTACPQLYAVIAFPCFESHITIKLDLAILCLYFFSQTLTANSRKRLVRWFLEPELRSKSSFPEALGDNKGKFKCLRSVKSWVTMCMVA